MTGYPQSPQDICCGSASSPLTRAGRLEDRNAALLASLKSLLRLWEAQAITGSAPDGDAWAEIARECHKARALIDRIEGGAS
jgi:hypothetical protein